jgi:hypothetical protein
MRAEPTKRTQRRACCLTAFGVKRTSVEAAACFGPTRFGDIASAVDKPLGQRAQRPFLEGEDIKPAERCGEIDGHLPDRRILAGHAYDAGGDDGKKGSRRCQTDPHVDCVGVDRRARGLDTVRTKCLDNERVVSASGRRPGPRFIHQLCEPDLPAAEPWILDPRNHDQWLVVQHLHVNVAVADRR